MIELQVKTRLLHPTKYYMQQSQRRQIQMYLTNELDDEGDEQINTTQSLPAVNTNIMGNGAMSNSAPADPDSPLSVGMSSTATSVSEVSVASLLVYLLTSVTVIIFIFCDIFA